MKFHFSIILFLILNASIYSQIKIINGIEIEILKAKRPSDFSTLLLRGITFDETKYEYIMVKCKVKSIEGNHARISAFSLVDTINKIRYRVGDYLGYAGVVGNPERNYFRKTKSENKNYSSNLPQYNPMEIDQFPKFNLEGYSNSEMPVEFGTKKNPDSSIVYFGQTNYKNFKAELFFIVPMELKISTFNLYYRDSNLGTVTIE
ncbi:hypothetical protein [Flavobacterium branchiicola]|uniref:Uncharacterized protein n=1 Tax=Flavobacterium branchiicola TaxID=1114875 RepID=A0ABV9PEX0_9FLAO|nr:hypothetical protein [Flavobacterium branchiicola]MBS7254365.1 hypothetical protein [Flavobacterium branchiicola]